MRVGERVKGAHQSPDIEPQAFGQLIFNKSPTLKQFNGERRSLDKVEKWYRLNGHMKSKYLTPHREIKHKYTIILIKLL